MITCLNCGNIYVKCETEAKGINVHTKIEDKDTIILTPEFYQITDTGKKSKLSCQCGELDIGLSCDYCGVIIKSSTVNIVEEKHKKKLVSCNRCAGDRPASSNITKVKIDSLKFTVTN